MIYSEVGIFIFITIIIEGAELFKLTSYIPIKKIIKLILII